LGDQSHRCSLLNVLIYQAFLGTCTSSKRTNNEEEKKEKKTAPITVLVGRTLDRGDGHSLFNRFYIGFSGYFTQSGDRFDRWFSWDPRYAWSGGSHYALIGDRTRTGSRCLWFDSFDRRQTFLNDPGHRYRDPSSSLWNNCDLIDLRCNYCEPSEK